MERQYEGMPVVRVGRELLFPGGATRRLSRLRQLAYRLGLISTVRPVTEWEVRGLDGVSRRG